MQSDFLTACQHTRERMEIPPAPTAAIRHAARNRGTEQGKHRRTVVAAFAASIFLVAVAAAAVLSRTHVQVMKSGWVHISSDTLTYTKRPTEQQLRSAATKLDFPAILPTGLPAGSVLAGIARFGTEALVLQYNLPGSWRASHHLLKMVIAHRTASGVSVDGARTLYTLASKPVQAHWNVGQEEVIAVGYAATPAELANIKRAMLFGHE